MLFHYIITDLADEHQKLSLIIIEIIYRVTTILSAIPRMSFGIQRLDGVSQYAVPVCPLIAT